MTSLSDAQLKEFFAKVDARLKQHMLAASDRGELALQNFVPKTGIGKFDAKLDVRKHRLDITVNFAYDWVRDRGNPEHQIWAPMDQIKFRQAAKPLIEKGWSELYTLTSAKPGWLDVFADVFVHFNEVDSAQAAYIVRVTKLRQFKSSGGIDHGVTPHVCGVNQFACEVDTSKNAGQAFAYKEGIIRNFLRQTSPTGGGDFVPFEPNKTELDTQASLALAKWTTLARPQLGPDLSALRLFVVGFRGKSDSVTYRHLESKRAEAVVAFLNTKLKTLDNTPIALAVAETDPVARADVTSLKARTTENPKLGKGGALVIVGTPVGAARVLPFRYVVMQHEFGHMLGLPDEYMGVHDNLTKSLNTLDAVIPATYQAVRAENNHERLQRMQHGMAVDLQTANVAAPNFMSTTGNARTLEAQQHDTAMNKYYDARADARTKANGNEAKYEAWKRKHPEPVAPANTSTVSTSIMHSGDEILPCHYVTIWSAIANITAGYIDPAEWKIVPNPRKPSTIARFKST